MEANLLTLFGSAVLSVSFAFLTMRWIIKDLRAENAVLKTQVAAATASAAASTAAVAAQHSRMIELETKVAQCERDREAQQNRFAELLSLCPVTSTPCPVRSMFAANRLP